MLAPVTDDDRAEFGYPLDKPIPDGVKVIGGNLPADIPKPLHLAYIGEQGVGDFDELLEILDSQELHYDKKLRCSAHAKRKEYLFDAGPPPSDPAVQTKTGDIDSHEPDRILVAYEVPTDLADEAQRFREIRGMWDDRGRFVIQATRERHKAFQAMLEATPKWRDPAAARERTANPVERKQVDGRTQLEWRSVGLTFAEETRPQFQPPKSPAGMAIVAVAPGSPAAWHDVRPGDILYEIEGFGTDTLAELESVLKTLLEGFTSESRVVQLKSLRPLPNNSLASIPIQMLLHPDDPNSPKSAQGPMSQEQMRRIMQIQQASNQGRKPQPKPPAARSLPDVPNHQPPPPEAEDAPPPKPRATASRPKKTPPATKSTLRYDGKTFDDWRTEWQTELSTEKRIEAVKALAAFGANGHGKDATEAIFDIATQYDWQPMDNQGNPTGKLQKEIAAAFAGSGGGPRIATKDWLPALIDRLKADGTNPRLQMLGHSLLMKLRFNHEARDVDLDPLLAIAHDKSSPIRPTAMRALAVLDPQHKNPKVSEYWQEILKSGDSKDTAMLLETLTSAAASASLQTDWLPLLLHDDEKIQFEARRAINSFKDSQPNKAKPLVEALQGAFDNTDDPAMRIAAIRSLASLRGNAREAMPMLERIMKNADQPLPLRIAAMTSLERITLDGSIENDLRSAVIEENQQRQNTPEFRAEYKRLEQAIQDESRAVP